jgi:hypothetical protein
MSLGLLSEEGLTPCPPLPALPRGPDVPAVLKDQACFWLDDIDVYPVTGEQERLVTYPHAGGAA